MHQVMCAGHFLYSHLREVWQLLHTRDRSFFSRGGEGILVVSHWDLAISPLPRLCILIMIPPHRRSIFYSPPTYSFSDDWSPSVPPETSPLAPLKKKLSDTFWRCKTVPRKLTDICKRNLRSTLFRSYHHNELKWFAFVFKGIPDLNLFGKPAVLGALARFILNAYVVMVCHSTHTTVGRSRSFW